MTPKQAIDHFGSQVAIADACKVTRQAVSLWFIHGCIPWDRQIQLERASKGVLKHSPKDVPANLRGLVQVAK